MNTSLTVVVKQLVEQAQLRRGFSIKKSQKISRDMINDFVQVHKLLSKHLGSALSMYSNNLASEVFCLNDGELLRSRC
jgi:hypothetical protein